MAPLRSAVLGPRARVAQCNYAVFIGFFPRTHFLMRFFESIMGPKPYCTQLIAAFLND
jgi:hypothetical protein